MWRNPKTFLQTGGSKVGSYIRKKIERKMATIESLKFDNLALRSLPLDEETENHVRQVPGACFSRVESTPVENPVTVATSVPAMKLLGLREDQLERPDFAEYFSGNKSIKGTEPSAHCYCGHQFGHFSGQLGDGAAMYLGEVLNNEGERWEIQFKGAGATPYSRSADGRKVLRSSIREFLCSEAIHHLGIPTTRAGSCVTSDSKVIRDIFYNGNPIQERCTIVLRIAQTFIRFGSFEIFKPTDDITGRKGPSVGRKDILIQLLDYTVKTFYPEIWSSHHKDKEKMYVEFFREVVRRTARLVAEWQCVGWCHGVLNTDNMSIYGLTIDYGPYGFMDNFDFDYICNGSDDSGRYSYKKQPEICRWNCGKLAEAIKEAVPLAKTKPELHLFDEEYERHYMEKMRKKLGFLKSIEEDKSLVESLFNTMHETGADFTNTFRTFSRLPLPGSKDFDTKLAEMKEVLLDNCCTVEELKKANEPRMDPRQLNMMMMLFNMNPDLLEQMGGGHQAILNEVQRLEKFKELKDLSPATKRKEDCNKWRVWLDMYVERLRQEAGGVADLDTASTQRTELMNKNNPRVILRNYLAQLAIEAAEKGDYSVVRQLLKVLENPYDEDANLEQFDMLKKDAKQTEAESSTSTSGASEGACGRSSAGSYSLAGKPPEWSLSLKVT